MSGTEPRLHAVAQHEPLRADSAIRSRGSAGGSAPGHGNTSPPRTTSASPSPCSCSPSGRSWPSRVDATVAGLSITTVGVILTVVGGLGLLLTLTLASAWSRRGETVVTRDREVL